MAQRRTVRALSLSRESPIDINLTFVKTTLGGLVIRIIDVGDSPSHQLTLSSCLGSSRHLWSFKGAGF
jgi:hypothetical protein